MLTAPSEAVEVEARAAASRVVAAAAKQTVAVAMVEVVAGTAGTCSSVPAHKQGGGTKR